ncbi:hypothetical protein [Marinicrinis lubricantis]|uniref:Uncharacterized protein n=1 Tax=Marinicrinis lubricantis TaxID=2086470 RepID=A0ABW1IKF6_9BACL
MKHMKKIVLTVALFGSGLWLGSQWTSIAETSGSPGTVNDPLVTKGYVDQKINELAQQIGSGGAGTGSNQGTASSLEIITLAPGETLYAGEGTEFTLRVGTAYAVSNDANGIPDVTEGTNIEKGSVIPRDHLLLFPREGRGIQADADQKGNVIVMVVGSYMHMDAQGNPK